MERFPPKDYSKLFAELRAKGIDFETYYHQNFTPHLRSNFGPIGRLYFDGQNYQIRTYFKPRFLRGKKGRNSYLFRALKKRGNLAFLSNIFSRPQF